MNTIHELGKISTYRPERGDLLHLFQLLNSSQEMTKELAQIEFTAQEKSDAHFRMVYKRLKDKLLDGIFSNSFSDYTKIQQVHFSIYKNYAGGKILVASENKKAALTVLTEDFYQAKKYGIIDVAESLSRELQNHYATVDLDVQKYKHFRKEKMILKRLRDEEMEAEDVLLSLVFAIKTQNKISNISVRLSELQQIENEQYKFNLYKFTCESLLATIDGDATKLLDCCKSAIQFFNQTKTPLPYITKWNFHFRAAPVLIAQGDYSKANAYLNQSAAAPSAGSYNHHLSLLYTCVCGFHSGKPKIALEAWNRHKKDKAKYESAIMIERWKVIQAYLHFYAKLDKIEMPGSFRLGRFLNETIKSSQRKPGQNVAIIIVQMLHLLVDGKLEVFSKKVDRLNDYIQSHLKGAQYDRSRLFLRMLQQIEFGDYKRSRVAERSEKYLVALRGSKISIGVDLLENEVVRYEVLWGLILEHLK